MVLRTVVALILSGTFSLLQAQDEHASHNFTSEFGTVSYTHLTLPTILRV